MTVGFLDPKLTIAIVLAQAAAALRDFSVLFVPAPGSCTFSETVKRYASPAEVATSYGASEINDATYAALNAAFALDRGSKIGKIAVAKLPAGVAQIYDIVIGGTIAENDTFTATVDGTSVTVTAPATPTPSDVATLLEAALGAALTDTHFTSVITDTVTVTNLVGTNPSQISVSKVSAAGTITATEDTAATTPSSALDTLLAADDDWYLIVTELKTTGWQEAVADWSETNKKFFWPQTADTRVLTGVITSDEVAISKYAVTNSLDYTAVIAHDDDTEELALLGACRWLSFDPDAGPTSPTYSNLSGITANGALTTTYVTNLETDNVAFYHYFRGVAALSEVRTGSGISARTRLLLDWLESRMGTAIANRFLTAGATGRPIPYDDFGFSEILSLAQATLDNAANIGWLRTIFDTTTNQRTSPLASVPRRSAVSPADAAAKRIPITFVAHDAGEATGASIDGSVIDATAV